MTTPTPTTPTPTETDDIGTRLAVVETEVRNINVQLERMHTDQQDARREQQAENRALRSELQEARREQQAENQAMRAEQQAENRAMNSRIDRLLYAVIGVGAVALVSLIGIIANLVIALID